MLQTLDQLLKSTEKKYNQQSREDTKIQSRIIQLKAEKAENRGRETKNKLNK